LKSPRFGERLLTNATTNLHRRLLRTRRERPCGRAAEKRDEGAAFHSITSSARSSREVDRQVQVGGIL
jgi:hypothetical protein